LAIVFVRGPGNSRADVYLITVSGGQLYKLCCICKKLWLLLIALSLSATCVNKKHKLMAVFC